MKKLIKHIRKWNHWKKHNANSWLYKLGVLFGFRKSPTMDLYFILDDEEFRRETLMRTTYKS